MATKKEAKENKKKVLTEEEKKARKEARKEAIKNRPEGQRTNSRQIDIVQVNENSTVCTYAYPIKNKRAKGGHAGVLVTSVLVVNGIAVSTSITYVEGGFKVKSKKGHGCILPDSSKEEDGEVDDKDEEVISESED